MQVVNTLKMIGLAVSDIPKAKAFYVDTLGLKITKDYQQDDDNWWVSLELPGGGTSINLSLEKNLKSGTLFGIYFQSPDIEAAHKELSDKGAKVGDVTNDLYGPGSGVKFFTLEDQDGNQVLLVEA